jgi:hypothetical protein
MIHFSLLKPAYAIICNELINPGCAGDVKQINDPKGYFNNLVQGIFSIFMLVAVLYFVWHFLMGAYHYIDSSGDEKKIEGAQKQLTYAFVGLFTAFSIFAILKLIGVIFGIPNLENLILTLPTL